MNTTAPAVEMLIATTGVCVVSLTKPSLSGATRSNDQAIMLRVVYAISAGIQNQIQAANVARITTERITLWPRMPASTANQGAVAVVWPDPVSQLKATAPWNACPKSLSARTANRAMTKPVATTAPSMPNSWDRRTFFTSPPMPTDWTAPSSGSSGQMRNFALSLKLVGAVAKPPLVAELITLPESSPVRLVRLDWKLLLLPKIITTAITARPATAITNSTRCTVK